MCVRARARVVDQEQPDSADESPTAVPSNESGLRKMLDSQNQAEARGETVDSYVDFIVAYATIPGDCDVLKIGNNHFAQKRIHCKIIVCSFGTGKTFVSFCLCV